MLTFCWKCKKNTENVDPKVLTTKNGKTILSSKMCSMKEQEAEGLLSSLGIKTPLSNIPLLGNIFFKFHLK